MLRQRILDPKDPASIQETGGDTFELLGRPHRTVSSLKLSRISPSAGVLDPLDGEGLYVVFPSPLQKGMGLDRSFQEPQGRS